MTKQTKGGPEWRKKGSGFDAPTVGKMLPKDAELKRNPDGTYKVVIPKNKKTAKK